MENNFTVEALAVGLGWFKLRPETCNHTALLQVSFPDHKVLISSFIVPDGTKVKLAFEYHKNYAKLVDWRWW